MEKNKTINTAGSVRNLHDLWQRLAKNIDDIEADRQFLSQAAEINNSAGKMIKIASTELEYIRLRKTQPDFPRSNLLEQTKS